MIDDNKKKNTKASLIVYILSKNVKREINWECHLYSTIVLIVYWEFIIFTMGSFLRFSFIPPPTQIFTSKIFLISRLCSKCFFHYFEFWNIHFFFYRAALLKSQTSYSVEILAEAGGPNCQKFNSDLANKRPPFSWSPWLKRKNNHLT